LLLVAPGLGAGPRFYPDDPLWTDRDTVRDAGAATERELSEYVDFLLNSFVRGPGGDPGRALNVNTVDEVPDSSWFTNRIGRGPLSVAEIVRGPDLADRLDVTEWVVVDGKGAPGFQPGVRAIDPRTKQLYQLEVDLERYPELASGAEVIGTALYHAIGYNVVDVYLINVDRTALRISDTATIKDARGRRRLVQADLDAVFRVAAQNADGTYRMTAGRFVEGDPMGPFVYYGTRPDDPNDIHPHEHRRELRGNRVFAAWINHDDSRGLNSLDMLEGPDGAQYVRHYMFDFGSVMGSGSVFPQVPRAGNEYILEWAPALKTLATLGLYVRPWIHVEYPDVAPSVGRFEADFFDPVAWRPEYPNPAFERMRPEDAFWAARLVARFSNEALAALVAKARYSDPEAAAYITGVLIARRDKVLRTWLTGVNPVVEPALSAAGTLTFENAAVGAGVASPPSSYALAWSRFDNATGTPATPAVEMTADRPRADAPAAVLEGSAFVSVAVRSLHPEFPEWATPVTLYFRRVSSGWEPVGLDR
jgi:hypothetical protein